MVDHGNKEIVVTAHAKQRYLQRIATFEESRRYNELEEIITSKVKNARPMDSESPHEDLLLKCSPESRHGFSPQYLEDDKAVYVLEVNGYVVVRTILTREQVYGGDGSGSYKWDETEEEIYGSFLEELENP